MLFYVTLSNWRAYIRAPYPLSPLLSCFFCCMPCTVGPLRRYSMDTRASMDENAATSFASLAPPQMLTVPMARDVAAVAGFV